MAFRTPKARRLRTLTALVGLPSLALACGSMEALPEGAPTADVVAAPGAHLVPLGRVEGHFDPQTGELSFTALPGAPSADGVGALAFGKRTSQWSGTEVSSVYSYSAYRNADCPGGGRNALCVVTTITSSSSYLIRNVYLQIAAITPGASAAVKTVSSYAGKNSDTLLSAHAADINAAGGASLGLWYFGHLGRGASKTVQMVFNNPDTNGSGSEGSEFSLVGQLWGDATTCTATSPADTPVFPSADTEAERNLRDTNCDGINGTASASVFVDPVRGSDTACAANPVAAEYPNDDSQGQTSCGNGTLRRPYATVGRALAARGTKTRILIASATGSGSPSLGSVISEPSTLTIPSGVSLHGGYSAADGFASRFTSYRAELLVAQSPGLLYDGSTSTLELLGVRTADLTGATGRANIGVLARGGSTVALSGVVLRTGKAENGAAGAAYTTAGTAGAPGTSATSVTGAVAPTPVACETQTGSRDTPGSGGNGGTPRNNSAKDGDNGSGVNGNQTKGGEGSRINRSIFNGSAPEENPSEAGDPGTNASSTSGVAVVGSLDSSGTYTATTGPSGGAGEPGIAGAGGGGSASTTTQNGGGGGSGGGAGCGGAGGRGGQGGGGAFSLVVVSSTVTFPNASSSVIVPGAPGNGGTGGLGQAGGAGGVGGSGFTALSGYRGGTGGTGGGGGQGGAGGGGDGGPRICVATSGTVSVATLPTCTLGAAGSGGAGGATGAVSGRTGITASQRAL